MTITIFVRIETILRGNGEAFVNTAWFRAAFRAHFYLGSLHNEANGKFGVPDFTRGLTGHNGKPINEICVP